MTSEHDRVDAVERAIRHYPEPLVDARELTDAVLEETDAFDELADARREVLDCLKVLRRTGEVLSHSPGSNAITWVHVDRVIRDPPPRDPAEHPDQAGLEETTVPHVNLTRDRRREDTPASGGGREHTDNAPAPSNATASVVESVDLPAGVDPERAHDAIHAAHDYLSEHGSATKAELVREVMPEYPLDYDVDDALEKIDAGDRYRGAWWRRVVKPGLEQLDDVQKPAPGRSEWRAKKLN